MTRVGATTVLTPLAALLSLALLALSSSTACAGSITGVFVEPPADRPLAAVEVVVRRAADTTLVAHARTAEDGRFRVDGLPPDRYLLRATLIGHQPWERADVALSASAPALDLGTLPLPIVPVSIAGVTTTTARASAIVAPDRNLYLTKDMPAATTGTATDILRTVPELDVDINGNVSLRGSASVTIQFNGRTSPLKGDALTTYLRQLPAGRIERVEVVANPSAKYDPEGTAGIVNLVLKDDAGLGLSGSVTATAGQRFRGPSARVAWQQGPLTCFGGVYGTLFGYHYDSSTERQSLLTTPPGASAWDVANRYGGRSGAFDASADLALTKRGTLYGTLNAMPSAYDTHALTHTALTTPATDSRYDRIDDGDGHYTTASFTLGFQHAVQAGKDERSIEYMQSVTEGGNHSDGLLRTFVPSAVGDQRSSQDGGYGYRERSLQLDDTRSLGARLKLESGYRGAERRTTTTSELRFFAGDTLEVTPLSGGSDFVHRERFHSGYLTLGGTFGRLSLQGGLRGELALTTFEARVSGRSYEHDYRSLFPSANVAWDLGKGRTLRATYSKRIERPSPYYLNPDVPSSDSLNRFVGNPDLGPRYTHSWGLDASWNRARGSLRLSPYLRTTVDNWDQVTHVDASGAATTTFLNASSVRVLGVSLTGSLRQTARLGGTLGLGVSREHHDAGNLSALYRRDVTGWTSNGNVTFKVTDRLDLQAYLRYAPPRALAQGRASAYVGSALSGRWKLAGDRAWASLTLNDPFNLSKYWSTTGDTTYTQSSTTHNCMRGVSAGVTWTWGKPPEQKQRRQSADQPPQGAPEPGR